MSVGVLRSNTHSNIAKSSVDLIVPSQMPSLSEALDNLRSQSEQLAALSTQNIAPAGPFVRAYLHLDQTLHAYATGSKPGAGSVLSLIRDASESERRLFKFVGEENHSNPHPNPNSKSHSGNGAAGSDGGIGGGMGGNKRVEKREGGLLTPLKELQTRKKHGAAAGGNGRDETEVILRTAMKLVDDYRPMPRARAHIANLLDTHHSSLERLLELERLIAEASKPAPVPDQPPQPSLSSGSAQSDAVLATTPDKPKLTTDEAIKAEEAALRALEASLIPLRKARRATPPAEGEQGGEDAFTNEQGSPPRATSRIANSPPANQTLAQSQNRTPFSHRTPAKQIFEPSSSRTPVTAREMPRVTNSLVTATPRRVDRFSPLKFLGTPRAPLGASGLGSRVDDGSGAGAGTATVPDERRTLFGRHRNISAQRASILPSGTRDESQTQIQQQAQTPGLGSTVNPKPFGSSSGTSTLSQSQRRLASQEEHDETICLPRPASPPVLAPPVVESNEPPTAEKQVDDQIALSEDIKKDTAPAVATESSEDGTRVIEGIDLDSEGVKSGVAKVWSTTGEMMHQGLSDEQVVEPDVASTVQHLHHLSQSNVPPPPSPSSSSTLSALAHPFGSAMQAKPITAETILFSHMFLSLLRAYSSSSSSSASAPSVGAGGGKGEVDMNVLKESLGAIAKDRKFDGAAGLGTKIIYAAVGKRIIKIERGGGGSRVRFAD